jgi:hypothetical protein
MKKENKKRKRERRREEGIFDELRCNSFPSEGKKKTRRMWHPPL